MRCIMKFFTRMIIILFIISVSPVFADQTNQKYPWKLRIDNNGIKIFNRTVEGSPIKEFMGTCVINSSIYTIGLIMMDFSNYSNWVASCKEMKKLSCKDNLNCTCYYVMDLPWPVSDRDAILKSSATVDVRSESIIIYSKSFNDESVPVPNGIIRLKSMYIKWILKQLPEGKTDVTFFSWADPSGQVPPFIANMATAEYPYKTLLNLAKMVQLPKYTEVSKKMNVHNYKQILKIK